MEFPIEIEPVGVGTRTGAAVVVSAPSADRATLDAAFHAIEAALARERLTLDDVVRNRLFAASREERDAGSAARFARLSGPARCATSSYIDEARFPGGAGIRLDTLALRGTGPTKVTVEHEPAQPPCRFVATGEHVFLSGLTSLEPELHLQLREIRDRLADTLAVAAARIGSQVRPSEATVFLHVSVGLHELIDFARLVGLVGIPIDFRRCEGFSKPGKLIEVEVDAVAAANAD